MAYINGARSIDRIVAAVKASFWPVMRVSWLTSPVAIAFAQNYLPPVRSFFSPGPAAPCRTLRGTRADALPTWTNVPLMHTGGLGAILHRASLLLEHLLQHVGQETADGSRSRRGRQEGQDRVG